MKFIVTAVDPRIGETVLDPAAGTGGSICIRLCASRMASFTVHFDPNNEPKHRKRLILRNQQQLPAMERNGILPTYKQEVASSNPALPTNTLCTCFMAFVFVPLREPRTVHLASSNSSH
jgi:hypothetical protein